MMTTETIDRVITTQKYDLKNVVVADAEKYEMMQDLVHALEANDTRRIQAYCPNTGVAAKLKEAFDQNREAIIARYGSREKEFPVAFQMEAGEGNRAAEKLVADHISKSVSLDLMKDISKSIITPQDPAAGKALSQESFKARKTMSLKFAAMEMALEQKSGEKLSFMSEASNQLAAIESIAQFENKSPAQRRMALKVIPHLDEKLAHNSHVEAGGKKVNVRWWERENSAVRSVLKDDIQRAMSAGMALTPDLVRFSSRHDMTDTGMPKGFYKRLQNISKVMEYARENQRNDLYEACLRNLNKLGEMTREHALLVHSREPGNNAIAEFVRDFKRESDLLPDGAEPVKSMQMDIANTLNDSFFAHDPELNLDLHADAPVEKVAPVLAASVMEGSMNGGMAFRPPQWMLDKYRPKDEEHEQNGKVTLRDEPVRDLADDDDEEVDELVLQRQKKMAEDRKFIENIQAVLGVGYIPGSASIEQQKAIALSLISSLPKGKERLKAISQQGVGEGINLSSFRCSP